MNTIDSRVMEAAALAVEASGMRYLTTVTIELDGATGGAVLTLTGFDSNDVSQCNERTVRMPWNDYEEYAS